MLPLLQSVRMSLDFQGFSNISLTLWLRKVSPSLFYEWVNSIERKPKLLASVIQGEGKTPSK